MSSSVLEVYIIFVKRTPPLIIVKSYLLGSQPNARIKHDTMTALFVARSGPSIPQLEAANDFQRAPPE